MQIVFLGGWKEIIYVSTCPHAWHIASAQKNNRLSVFLMITFPTTVQEEMGWKDQGFHLCRCVFRPSLFFRTVLGSSLSSICSIVTSGVLCDASLRSADPGAVSRPESGGLASGLVDEQPSSTRSWA